MKKIEFKNRKGLILRGFIHEPKRYDTAILTLHGFPGTCTGDRIQKTARLLEKKGFLVMRFDFSGTNISDGKFEEKLMSEEVNEIRYAIDFLFKKYKFKRFILHGHSTGATDASLYAHKDKRINKLVLSGALERLDNASHFDFNDRQVREFWEKGHIRYGKSRYWVSGKKLKRGFYDEFFRLDINKAMKRYRRPLLIIHGSEDKDVPLDRAKDLYKITNRPKKLVIIKDADHRFTKKAWLERFVDEVAKFARR